LLQPKQNNKKQKKMKRLSVLWVALAALTLFSCAPKKPLTNQIIQDYKLGEGELKKLQYYVSSDIVLRRGEKKEEEKGADDDGKLVISEQASLDEIYIPAGTPGVCVGVYPGNKIAISFDEKGDDSKFLVFGDPNNTGRYRLMGAEWKNGQGKLNYGGKVYYATGSSAAAYLKISMKRVKKFKRSRKKVKGRRV
tara:strand:+ start:167637 stop:168218 length:582 start_codon:yes stop_codon:yes gene_type:complete